MGFAPGRLHACGEPRGAAATPGDVTIQAIQRGTAYLLQSQNKDGSWGGPQNAAHEFWSNPETHRSWQVGTTGLCCMTLMDQWQSGAGPEAEIAAAVKRALDYLSGNTDLKRPSDWDTDNTWGYIYGLQATSRASAFPKLAKAPERDSWRSAAEQFAKQLKRYQSPNGGWGYYADDTASWRSEWATSFMTAVSVLAHLEAKKAGIPFDPEVLAKAVKAVERCKLPNGAYSYDVMATPRTFSSETINDVKGSLGRIQVCNLALRRAGVAISDADLRTGLDEFFEYHKSSTWRG